MNLLLIGYYGSGNCGDEAILESFLRLARTKIPGAQFTALSASPEQTLKRYGIRAVGKKSFSAIRSAMKWADVVVAPGGGLIQDTTSAASAIYYISLIFMARRMRRPVYLMSQGIGPLNRPFVRRLAGTALNKCARVWARDVDAFNELVELGVHGDIRELSADMVAALHIVEKPAGAGETGKGLIIGVSLRPDKNIDRITGCVAAVIARIANEQHGGRAEVRFITFDEVEDAPPTAAAVEKIKAALPGAVVSVCGSRELEAGSSAIAKEYRGMDVFIGMRLHSLVFASLTGVPFVAICYDPKVAAFANKFGAPSIYEPDNINDDALLKCVQRVSGDNHAKAAQKIRDIVADERDKVSDMMDHFLKHRDYDKQMKTLGVPVSGLGLDETISEIERAARERHPLHIVTINPEMVLRARHDMDFRALLQSGTMNTPDGVGVRIAALIKYGKRLETVTGAAITARLLEISREKNLRIYMIGGSEDVIEKVAKNMESHPARPIIAGCHHGYIKGLNLDELAESIRKTNPDIVLAGMGVPLQEYWIRDFGAQTGASVFVGIGGMFDVLAGVKKRAPAAFQKIGMEWLWRLVSEPTRFKRIAPLPMYLPLAIRDSFRR